MGRLQTAGWVVVLMAVGAQAPRAGQAPAAQKPELVLQTGQTTVSHLAFSPDGRLLASGGSFDNGLHLWDVANGLLLRTLKATPGTGDFGQAGVAAIAFGSGNRLVAAAFGDGGAAVWEIATGRKIREFAARRGDTIRPLAPIWFDRDEKTLFGTRDQNVVSFDLASGNERTNESAQTLCSAGLAPSGREYMTLEMAMPSQKDQAKAARKMMEDLMKGGGVSQMPSFYSADLVLREVGSGRQTTKKSVPGVGTSRSPNAPCAVATTDGRILVPTIANNSVQVIDALAGGSPKVYTSPEPLDQFNASVTLARDGRTLAAASGQTIVVWDAGKTTPAYVKRVDSGKGDIGNITSSDFTSDGRLMAVGTQDGVIAICERATGVEIARFAGGVNIPVAVAFASAGRRLFGGERTRWDLDSGRAERVSAAPFGLATAVSDDGRTMAIGHVQGTEVEIWDANQKARVATLAPSGRARVSAVGLSRDGKRAAVSYARDPTEFIQAQQNLLSGAGFDPFQMMTPRPPAKGGKGAPAAGPDLAAIQKLQEQVMNLVSGQGSDELTRQIKVYDTATGSEVSTLTGTSFIGAFPTTIRFSPDGSRVAIVYFFLPDPVLFDVATGNRAVLGPPPQAPPPSARNTGAVPGVSQDVLDIANDPRAGTRRIGTVAFSPDGTHLAVPLQTHSEGFSGTPAPGTTGPVVTGGPIEIWDVAGVKKIAELPGHRAGTQHAVYSVDGKQLVTGSYDNEIVLWDVAAAKEVRKIGRSASTINALALSPDAKVLATGSFDGATRLWDVARGEEIATLLSVNDGGDWLVVTPDGLFDGTPAAWNKILWRFSQNTFDVAPVEVFFNEYYYPDLLADLMAGKRPKASADLAQKDRRQAEVMLEVAGAASAREVSTREVTVKVQVTKAPAGARDLRLFRNGSLVKIWHGDAAATGSFEIKVPIVAGANRFSAYVFNNDNVKSTDAVASVTGAASLARRGIGYVIAAGVNEYENPDYNLKYAVADAESFSADVKAQLEKQNRVARVEVTLIKDRQATKSAILDAIRQLAARVQPEDEVLVFVASHGTAAADRFYIIPSDLGYTGKRTELDDKAVQAILAHSISDQELEQAFEGLNAGRLLLVIDACNSGQALEAEEKRRGPMNSKGLAQLAYEKGMYVLTASQSFQAAQEVSQLGHGLLTYALVTEGLDQGSADAAPKDGNVAAREWLDFATGRVPRIQLEKMDEARKLGRTLRFGTGARGDAALDAETLQHPRVFYRRELDEALWIVGKPR